MFENSDEEITPLNEDEKNNGLPKGSTAFEEVLFDEDDEDDEILKALDKFFIMNDDDDELSEGKKHSDKG